MADALGLRPRLEDVEAARARIAGRVLATPTILREGLIETPIFVKAEGLQRTGSFKIRGVFNALLQLAPRARATGVITLSAGNHGLALAVACAALGIPCVVVIPDDAPPMKVAAIAAAGAELVRVPRAQLGTQVDLERERRGLQLVHPFDDEAVIAGQGTIGLEILDAVPEVATIVVPVGGGGLIAGIAVAVKETRPSVRIVGVEPAIARAVADSLRAGHPVPPERLDSVADGLSPPYTRPLNLDLIGRFVDDMVQVTDDAIIDAVRALARDARLVVEPSGAAAVAALRTGAVSGGRGPVVAVQSGSNVDPVRLSAWLGS